MKSTRTLFLAAAMFALAAVATNPAVANPVFDQVRVTPATSFQPIGDLSMNDPQIEAMIQAKGLTAARVTPGRVEAVIVKAYFHRVPDTTLTLCVLTLANGFTVTGESACASPENFDVELGERIALDDAKRKIWALEGYALRERLAGETSHPAA